MKKVKLLAALTLLCAGAVFSSGCGVEKEEADVILESWSETDSASDNPAIDGAELQ